MKKIRVISSILTIGIMALIFFFSYQNSADSSELSRGITYRIAELIISLTRIESMDAEELTVLIHNFIRKCAHFSEYAALGMSAYVTIRLSISKTAGRARIYTILFCMLYAVTDEIHQYFVPGRAERIFDVFVDTCGAAAGVIIVSILIFIIKIYWKRKG
ncbi:MAG: VanZ family protein, partial [Candidatus Ornithomonoglobus sp.]